MIKRTVTYALKAAYNKNHPRQLLWKKRLHALMYGAPFRKIVSMKKED